MYQLKYKNYILYDPRLADEKLIVRDPSVKLAVSKAGEMSFTVDAEHPYLSNLRRMSGLVELLYGTFPIYRGRITSDIKDFYGAHKIETEGIMAVLNDSIIPPFNFPGISRMTLPIRPPQQAGMWWSFSSAGFCHSTIRR